MFRYFFVREIKEKYLGNLTGISWVFIQPIITLTIYWLVFDKIFGAKIPEAQDIGFIVYLAIGLWPWMAFSESIIRSIMVVSEKDSLIGKVKIDFKIPVIASISANFMLSIIGYVIVLSGLVIFADTFNYSRIFLVIIPVLQMYVFAIAIGLLLSSLQIFIRDIHQFMATMITLWFFLTPIIYSETFLPESYRNIIKYNPMYTPITFIHKALITKEPLPWVNMGILTVCILIFLYFSIKIFDKLSPNFEAFK